MKKQKAKKIGVCAVESGRIIVGDPCYFWPSKQFKRCAATDAMKTWDDVCDRMEKASKEKALRIDFASGARGLGVIVDAPLGDGAYPVYLEEDNGKQRLIVDLS